MAGEPCRAINNQPKQNRSASNEHTSKIQVNCNHREQKWNTNEPKTELKYIPRIVSKFNIEIKIKAESISKYNSYLNLTTKLYSDLLKNQIIILNQ